jgi:hypothetical protein
VIVTMRSKTEYVMVEEVNRQGKTVQVPRKIGLAPIQRDGMEYEFDLYGRMDQSNQIQISKSRCSAMSGRTSDKPGPAFWQPLFDWISSAPAAEPAAPAAAVPSVEEIQEAEFQRLLTVIGQANDLDFLALAAETVKANKSKISEEHSKKLREYYAARKDAITKSIQRTAAPAPDAATGEVAAAAS